MEDGDCCDFTHLEGQALGLDLLHVLLFTGSGLGLLRLALLGGFGGIVVVTTDDEPLVVDPPPEVLAVEGDWDRRGA